MQHELQAACISRPAAQKQPCASTQKARSPASGPAVLHDVVMWRCGAVMLHTGCSLSRCLARCSGAHSQKVASECQEGVLPTTLTYYVTGISVPLRNPAWQKHPSSHLQACPHHMEGMQAGGAAATAARSQAGSQQQGAGQAACQRPGGLPQFPG